MHAHHFIFEILEDIVNAENLKPMWKHLIEYCTIGSIKCCWFKIFDFRGVTIALLTFQVPF